MKPDNPFQVVAEACKRSGVSVILVGGYALGAHGHQRFTRDVDFLVSEQDIDKLISALSGTEYGQVLRSPVVVRFAPKKEWGEIIDLMPVDSKTFERMKAEAKEEQYGGERFLVPKLEHLIAMKLHALRDHFETRKIKDLPDIAELLNRNQVDVTSEEFRKLCLKYGTAELYQQILNWVKPNG